MKVPKAPLNSKKVSDMKKSFGARVLAVPAPPCEDNCPQFYRCANERLACGLFSSYVGDTERALNQSRQPRKEIYDRLHARA